MVWKVPLRCLQTTAYDGIYPLNKIHCPVCLAGKKENEQVALVRCSRCKIVYYCGKQCQAAHFKEHKQVCKRVLELNQKLIVGHKKLAAIAGPSMKQEGQQSPPEAMSLMAMSQSVQTMNEFMDAEMELAITIEVVAYRYETKDAWEQALHHSLEIMRMDELDQRGTSFRFPYILLHLNRDDDAYQFCYYRAKNLTETTPSDYGTWMFGHRTNCRFLDFFEDCSIKDPTSVPLYMLMAIAIIKLRLLVKYDFNQHSVAVFQKTKAGNKLGPVIPVVAAMCAGDDAYSREIRLQRKQFNRLLDQIHANNPSLLPSLLNPTPFHKKWGYNKLESPTDAHRGYPFEAYCVMDVSYRLWHRIPGAKELLEARFGPNPSYDCDVYRHMIH